MLATARLGTWIATRNRPGTAAARGGSARARFTGTQARASELGVLGVLGLLALLSPLSACGSDSKPATTGTAAGGTTGTGAGSGGITGAGGSLVGAGPGGSSAGGSTGSTGAGGSAGILPMESGMAQAKFCNPLETSDMKSVEFTLEIGSKNVPFVASSGKCAPLKGVACAAIPAGSIAVRLKAGGQLLGEGVTSPIPNGAEMFFVVDVDVAGDLFLDIFRFPSTVPCKDFDLDAEIPDGGAGDAGSTPLDAGGGGGMLPRLAPNLPSAQAARLGTIERVMLARPATGAMTNGATVSPRFVPGKWQAPRP